MVTSIVAKVSIRAATIVALFAAAILQSSAPAQVRAQSNNAPTFAAATATRQVQENAAAGTNVGAPVTATDLDEDALTYSLIGMDAASFAISMTTGQLTVGTGTELDYETKARYSVMVTADDGRGGRARATVTIEVSNVAEAGLMGRVVITVAQDGAGTDYGYESGDYGTLVSGQWPADLFLDGNARTVSLVREDGDYDWYWHYSGGAANDWVTDQEALDQITVTVSYADGKDSRHFVLGGAITERPANNGLRLDPPLPSRDWDDKTGQEVTFEFRRRTTESAPVVQAALVAPPGAPGTFIEFLSDTVPGGPVTFQTMVTILVFASVLWKSPATPFGIMFAAIVLVLTPWGPVLLGYGDPIASTIVLVNVTVGAFAYKLWVARTEN